MTRSTSTGVAHLLATPPLPARPGLDDDPNATEAATGPAAGESPSSWKSHIYVGLPLGLVLLTFIWMVTYGTWQLTVPENFGQFFDVQADSLLAGRWDVPPQGIAMEAFIHDGKFYGYFGFVPALARIPLNAAFPGMWGCWSRLSLTVGSLVALGYAYLLVLEIRRAFGFSATLTAGAKWVYGGFLIAAGLGSTLIFLSSRAYIYHEATLWGGALAVGCYYHMTRYLRKPTAAGLMLVCGLCFCSFFSRVSVGSGTVAAVSLLAASLAAAPSTGSGQALHPFDGAGSRRRRAAPLPWLRRFGCATPGPKWHALAAAGTVIAVGVVYVAVNQVKFGTWLDGMPFKSYGQIIFEPSQERMHRTHGSAMSWANFRTDVNAYFSLKSIHFTKRFPFAGCRQTPYLYRETRYDYIEPFSSLTASMPALSLLAMTGLLGAFAQRRGLPQPAGPEPINNSPSSLAIPVVGAIVGALPVLLSAGISERYLHDFFPLLVLGAALGLHRIMALRWALPRGCLWLIGAGLVLFSAWANFSFALTYQRVIVRGVPPEKQLEFLHWQDQVAWLIESEFRR